jgi:hypothetical protein
MTSVLGRAIGALSLTAVLSAVAMGCGGGGSGGGFGSSVDGTKTTVTVDRPTGVLPNGVDAATVTVTALNSNDTPVSGVTIAVTGPTGVTIASTSSAATTGSNGIATFKVTSTSEGTKTLQAAVTYNGSTIDVAQFVTITFAAIPATGAGATTLVASPTAIVADNSTTSTITVQVRNAAGADISGAAVTFATTAPATLSALTAMTDANGLASSTIQSTLAGPATVTVTAQNGMGTPIITQTVTVTFFAGKANSIVWHTQPTSSVAGDQLTGPFVGGVPTVGIIDQFGNLLDGSFGGPSASNLVQVHVFQNGVDLGGIFNYADPATTQNHTTVVAQNGLAAFNYVGLSTVGSYQLVAQATGLGVATSSTFNITPGPIAVAPGGLAFIGSLTNGAGLNVLNTVSGSACVCSVSFVDRFGNATVPAAPTVITLSVTGAPAGVTLGGTVTATTDAVTGVAAFNLATITDTTIMGPGFAATTRGLTATAPGAPAPVAAITSFQVTGTAAQSPTTAAAAITLTSGNNGANTVTRAAAGALTFTLHETDSLGGAIVGDTITASLVGAGPTNPQTGVAGSLQGTKTAITNASGDATFSALFVDMLGTYHLTFTSAQLTVEPAFVTLHATTAGPADHLVFIDQGFAGLASCPDMGQPRNANVNANVGPVQVAIVDQDGNLATGSHAIVLTPSTTVNVNGGPTVTMTGTGVVTFASIALTSSTTGTLLDATHPFNGTLSASSAGLPDVNSVLPVASATFRVSTPLATALTPNGSASSSRIAFSVQPTNTQGDNHDSGTYFYIPISPDPTISILDSVGALVSGDTTDTYTCFLRTPPTNALTALPSCTSLIANNGILPFAAFPEGSSDLGVGYFLVAQCTTGGVNQCAISGSFDLLPARPSEFQVLGMPDNGSGMSEVKNGTVIGSTQPKPATSPTTGVSPGPFYSFAILDESGQLCSTSSAQVTVTLDPASANSAILTGTTSVNAVNGVATFTNLTLTAPAAALPVTVQLNFTSPGLNGICFPPGVATFSPVTAMINITH